MTPSSVAPGSRILLGVIDQLDHVEYCYIVSIGSSWALFHFLHLRIIVVKLCLISSRVSLTLYHQLGNGSFSLQLSRVVKVLSFRWFFHFHSAYWHRVKTIFTQPKNSHHGPLLWFQLGWVCHSTYSAFDTAPSRLSRRFKMRCFLFMDCGYEFRDEFVWLLIHENLSENQQIKNLRID